MRTDRRPLSGTRRGTLPAMETAIRNNDAKDVRSIAHRLRGASLTCGSNSIVPFLNELEETG
mgnify:CR=1 FL=1